LNLQRIVRQTAGDGESAQKSEPKAPSGREESSWVVTAGAVDITETALTYQDSSRTPALDAGLGDIMVTLSAEVDAAAAETKVRLKGISVAAKKIHAGLLGSPEPAVKIDRLALEDGAFDLGQRLVTLSRVGFDGGHVDVAREAGGEINLTQLLAPPQSGAVRRGSEEAAAGGNPWRYAVKTVEVSGVTTAFYDRTVKADEPLLTLNPLDVSLTDVDGKSPMGFKADIKINAGGSVTAAGTIDPSGPTVESRIDVAGVVLTPLQPYIEPVAKLEMHSGELSSQGTLRYGMKDVGADLAYDGGLNLAKLRLTESGSKDTLEKDEDKAAQSAVQPPQTKKAADPGELSKAIYARLVDSEPLPATVLTELAEARARAIVAVLTGDGAVAPARLSTKPSGPLPKDAPVTAKLSLVVSRKSS
jgi:hypothetical protein